MMFRHIFEPFRWLCDVTVIEAFESGTLDLKDFYFMGDDYRYHVEVEGKRRLLELLSSRFNAGVKYEGKICKWNTIILKKTQELARFLLDKSKPIAFINPSSDSLNGFIFAQERIPRDTSCQTARVDLQP